MRRAQPEGSERLIATNRKAFHDYHILEKIEAGLALRGTEVKSLREGRANLTDGYVQVRDGEALLVGVHISPYTHGNIENHDPLRTRNLLMHARQIRKIEADVAQKGLTVVPLRLYFRSGIVKVEIAVVRGKKLHDKRETERRREADREASIAMKESRR